MKKRFLLPLCALLLSGCKTSDLYARNLYNSPVFDENYYTIHDDSGLGDTPSQGAPSIVTPTHITSLSKDCMSETYTSFKTGILSKLYDGRTECGGLYQLSRVQLDKTGFGTRLPETVNASSFEFAARGGTTCEMPLHTILHFNFTIDLIEEGTKVIHTYQIDNLELPTDKGGATYIYHFDLETTYQAYYYSIRFSCVDLPNGVTDDYTVGGKDHLAIMLYEVLIN